MRIILGWGRGGWVFLIGGWKFYVITGGLLLLLLRVGVREKGGGLEAVWFFVWCGPGRGELFRLGNGRISYRGF